MEILKAVKAAIGSNFDYGPEILAGGSIRYGGRRVTISSQNLFKFFDSADASLRKINAYTAGKFSYLIPVS